jgi:hypothetical protein
MRNSLQDQTCEGMPQPTPRSCIHNLSSSNWMNNKDETHESNGHRRFLFLSRTHLAEGCAPSHYGAAAQFGLGHSSIRIVRDLVRKR